MSIPGLPARLAAAQMLSGVLVERRLLSDQVAGLSALEPHERARAQSIAAGVLRRLDALDAAIDPHLEKATPLKARQVLRIAAWEMLADGIAPHAAVNAAVAAVKRSPKAGHLGSLVNAVARRVAEGALGDAVQTLPKPLRTPMVKAWGKTRVAAMEVAHARVPPLDLSLRRPEEADLWARRLGAEILPTGSLRLTRPGQVSALPGFEDGAWWVQDAAAALPAKMLGQVQGLRVLDLCVAPGGKTMQLAAAGAQVTALDASPSRLERLTENLARTGLTAEIVTADARVWTPDAPFDAILLDAPCSATGTIRRHPDLPYLRAHDDIRPLVALQAELLARALGWLTPDGRLVYATCSLLPMEGERQIAALGDRVTVLPAHDLPEGLVTGEGYLRTAPDFWPETGGMDGFFGALLARKAGGG